MAWNGRLLDDDVEVVEGAEHREPQRAPLAARLAAGHRSLSLVDCTSFEIMRRHGLGEALTLDRDFARQGFRVTPAPAGHTV